MIFSEKIHRYIYIFSLFLLAIAIPTSVFLMSLSQFILYGNWILEGRFKEKWTRIKSNKSLWIFISIFFIHLLWLLPPQDYSYAFNDIRIKLPLALLPFFIVSSKVPDYKTIKLILIVFTASVVFTSFIALYRWIFQESLGIFDYRQFSPFISHIRYSLMIVFSIYILFFFSFIEKENKKILHILYTIAMLYLVVLLFILKINTGIFVFTIVSIITFIYFLIKTSYLIRWFIGIAIIIIFVLLYNYSKNIWNSFIVGMQTPAPDSLVYTPNGNAYYFIKESKEVENGNKVWYYIQEYELRKEWNKRSSICYDCYDFKGNNIKFTLIRYLTSKGLTKDSLGCSKLSIEDIKAIEKGIANYKYTEKWSFYPYIYSLMWDYYSYKYLGNVNGSSIFQRLEYLKTALAIINDHFWFGVGTGNVQKSFDKKYNELKSSLKPEFRLRAHNQLITFLLTFGIFAFVWIIFAFIYPYFKQFHPPQFLSLIFFLIVFISFFNEDTLETQAGITFVVYFYTLFAFSK
ncbi:MAG: O-antigen ligase family protein [Bacteroidales bacterium]